MIINDKSKTFTVSVKWSSQFPFPIVYVDILLAASFQLINFPGHMLQWHRPNRLHSYAQIFVVTEDINPLQRREGERRSSQVTKTNEKL